MDSSNQNAADLLYSIYVDISLRIRTFIFSEKENRQPGMYFAKCGIPHHETVNGQPKESTKPVPKSVLDKWAAALVTAHGPSCVFSNQKRRSRTAGNVNGQHLYQFVLTGAPSRLSPRVAPRATLAARAPGPPTPPTQPPGPNRRLR